MEIENIRDLDDLVFEEFQIYFPKISSSKFKEKYPITLKLSILFTTSTNFIKNSIFDCSENDDLFGAKILFRSLIEHFLRFKYVWFNWAKYKDDDCARKYLEFNEAREILDSLKSEIDKYKLMNPDFQVSSWSELLDKFPNMKNLSKKEIEEETLKYTYKNIIKFIQQTIKNQEVPLLGSLILEYSKLSSFVHGGIGAHQELLTFNNEKDRVKEYERICGLSFQIASSVKLFSLLMIVQTDSNEFDKSYLVIDNLMKRINKTSPNNS